jgi:hypothetical protein
MFNVTYWPYVQVSTAYNCISLFFSDSFYNLSLDDARHLLSATALTFGLAVGLSLM